MPNGELILYQTEDDRTCIDVRFEDESVWLTQVPMVQLFDIGVGTISHRVTCLQAQRGEFVTFPAILSVCQRA